MWGIDFMNARHETPESTRQETPVSTRQETPVNFDYRACGGGLHESLADLGPQVKAFTEAFESFKSQLLLLQHEAQMAVSAAALEAATSMAELDKDSDTVQVPQATNSPSAADSITEREVSAEEYGMGRMTSRDSITLPTQHRKASVHSLSSTSSPVDRRTSDNTKKTRESKKERSKSTGKPHFIDAHLLELKVPQALAQHLLVHSQDEPATSIIDERDNRTFAYGRTMSRLTINAVGEQPELDMRWRDLYLSNEAKAEEYQEMRAQESSAQQQSLDSMIRVSSSMVKALGTVSTPSRFNVLRNPPFHPYSRGNSVWLICGMVLLLYDSVMIPFNGAWNRDPTGHPLEFMVFLVSMMYWTADMLVSFNTGIFADGVLVMIRADIVRNYCRTWLLFDIVVVSLDYVFLAVQASGASYLKGSRVLRFWPRMLRGLRLVRMLKMRSAGAKFGELAATMRSVNKVIIVAAVLNIFLVIFMMAHILACIWFFIGTTMHDNGTASWLDLHDFDTAHISVQYMRSLHWVIALMTTNTNDRVMAPENQLERSFTILVIMLSILILGLGASKLGNTVGELNRMNADVDNTRTQLQQFLRANAVSVDLSTRIMRFALFTLQRRTTMKLDSGVLNLLSKKMQAELIVSQRNPYLMIHPLFKLINDVHPETLLDVFSAFETRLYSDGECIFSPRTWSEFFCVTANGTYCLQCASAGPSLTPSVHLYSVLDKSISFDKPQWFSEVSLFARVMHRACLTATSFGDAFTLSGLDFANSVRRFPSCVGTIYRYATAYLGWVWLPPGGGHDKILLDDLMPISLAEKSCKVAQAWLTRFDLNLLSAPPTNCDTVNVTDFVKRLSAGDISDATIKQQIPLFFPELHAESGTYATMEKGDERQRAVCAVLCVFWLRNGCYESFVESQSSAHRMSRDVWEQWQLFVGWLNISDEMFHATLVFVSLHGLGKVQSFANMVPRDQRSPENVVIHLIKEAEHLTPSVAHLSDEMVQLVLKAFEIHSQFNLAQMLQGENNASHIQNLQQCIQDEGEDLLKFYLFNLVGMMCATRGMETLHGSLFMDHHNGCAVLVGVHCLQHLTTASPHAIYWTYIQSRAEKLQLPTNETEHFIIARLACLIRAEPDDLNALHVAWAKLSPSDRQILTKNFLADGISQTAYLLVFLSLYLSNAKTNQAVGLHLALTVLIGFLDLLENDGCNDRSADRTIQVSLADVAAFTRDVKSPRLFEVAAACAKVDYAATEVQITISTKHWQCVNQRGWQDEPLEEMGLMVKKIERKSEAVLETTRALLQQSKVRKHVPEVVCEDETTTV